MLPEIEPDRFEEGPLGEVLEASPVEIVRGLPRLFHQLRDRLSSTGGLSTRLESIDGEVVDTLPGHDINVESTESETNYKVVAMNSNKKLIALEVTAGVLIGALGTGVAYRRYKRHLGK